MTKYLLICLVVGALIFQGCWHHESAVERGYNEKYIGCLLYTSDVGYTWAVQLDEKRVLVVYYINFDRAKGTRHIQGSI